MTIEQYTIKSKRQENGLFGTPRNVSSMKNVPFNEDEEIISSIICAMGEIHKKHNISVDMLTSKHMVINVHKPEDTDRVHIKLEQYSLVKNKLYYFQKPEDKIDFYRKLKIKKIKHSFKKPI